MKKRHTIDLDADEIKTLLAVAKRCNATARAGIYSGRPSWRALLREIAAGRVVCRDKLKKP
jgi:hypothetical protein